MEMLGNAVDKLFVNNNNSNIPTSNPNFKLLNSVLDFVEEEQEWLKNLHRQAFSEEQQHQQQQQQQSGQDGGRLSIPAGGDQQLQVGQIGTGTADNIAFWVPPTVAGKTSRRHRGMLRNNMTFDCGDATYLSSSLSSPPPPISPNNNTGNNQPQQQLLSLPHQNSGDHVTPVSTPLEGSDLSSSLSGLSWSSVTPASMDLFKKFTEKTVEVKNMILGNEALSSITSAVANTAGTITGGQQNAPAGDPNAINSSLNGSYTNHNTLPGHSTDGTSSSISSGDAPPVVIPSLSKSSSRKGHSSMHQAIDFRQINTNLYTGEKKRMPTVQQANVDTDSGDDDVGTIKLIFEYQRANGIFVVTVDKVSGIPAPSDGSSLDPFCHVQLLPDKRVIATKVLRGSLNPDFHEQIMFDVAEEDDLPNRILELTVAHRDQSATGQIIGWLRLAMNSFDFNARPGPIEVYRPLSNPDKKEGTKALGGNVLISVSYLATAKRLTIYIHEAKGLKFADENGTSGQAGGGATASPAIDASVRVTLVIDGKKSKKKKTATQHGANVVWNEAITFTDMNAETITSGRLQAIDVEVAHETLLGDKPLGHVLISASTGVPLAQAQWQAMRQGDDTPRWQRLRFA